MKPTPHALDARMEIRVPRQMLEAIDFLARTRMSTPSAYIREALALALTRDGVTLPPRPRRLAQASKQTRRADEASP